MAEPYAFISYARRDRVFVDKLAADLQQAGIRIWRDTEQIQPGQQWQRAIEDALTNAVALLYVASEQSSSSVWMERELLGFFKTRKFIIPVIIDDAGAEALPLELRQFQWVDFRKSYDDGLRKLLVIYRRVSNDQSV